MRTLKAAVIGCGNIARFHFSGLEKAGAKIKWVCDVREEAARPWAQKYGACYTSNFREILADPEVDVVNVTLPSHLHKAACLEAIAAGKAVICEKTLSDNPDDAMEIVRAAESAGTIFYTSYMKRFLPAVAKAKELLPSLGRIISTHMRTHQCWGDLWNGNPAEGFFHTPAGGASQVRKNYGGGVLICGGSHLLDLVGFFLGRPHRLYAQVHTPPDGRDYDLLAAVLMETANGVVHWEALAHSLNRIGFLRDGWDETIQITGVNGRLDIFSSLWDQPETKASLLVHYDNATGNTTEYRFEPSSPFDAAINWFLKNISCGTQGKQSRGTGYEVDELIAHIEKSSRTRQAIDIDWKPSSI
jgi:predicted dehydrogenase